MIRLTLAAASLLALTALPAEAQDTQQLIAACVEQVRQDNRLTDTGMRSLQAGQLFQVYGSSHALAKGETIAGLCARTEPMRAAAREHAAALRMAEEGQRKAEESAMRAEKALADAQGSWWRQNYELSWIVTLLTLASVALYILRRIRKAIARRRMSRSFSTSSFGVRRG